MLGREEIRLWVDHFGTPEAQVRRDHVISHVLARLPGITPDATFFGGTALCRTHVPDWRLSEDIDLLVEPAVRDRQSLDAQLPAALRREYPGLAIQWAPEGETTVGTISVDELSIRVQLVPVNSSYRRYPIARMPVALRYQDLPQTVDLPCPTREGAAAMKLNAWAERGTTRDLCDLYGLQKVGALTHDALRVARSVSSALQKHSFGRDRMPSSEAWQSALGHQMREVPELSSAFAAVRTAIAGLEHWGDA